MLAERMHTLCIWNVRLNEGVILGAFPACGCRDIEVWAEHVDVEVDGL